MNRLSRLHNCSAFLAGLPSSSIKPLQLNKNVAARIVFNKPKRVHVTPLFISLFWLPIAARIKLKELIFAYKTTTGSAPLYLNSLLHTYVSQKLEFFKWTAHCSAHSQTFTLTVPCWRNLISAAKTSAIFKKQLKTHIFHLHLIL